MEQTQFEDPCFDLFLDAAKELDAEAARRFPWVRGPFHLAMRRFGITGFTKKGSLLVFQADLHFKEMLYDNFFDRKDTVLELSRWMLIQGVKYFDLERYASNIFFSFSSRIVRDGERAWTIPLAFVNKHGTGWAISRGTEVETLPDGSYRLSLAMKVASVRLYTLFPNAHFYSQAPFPTFELAALGEQRTYQERRGEFLVRDFQGAPMIMGKSPAIQSQYLTTIKIDGSVKFVVCNSEGHKAALEALRLQDEREYFGLFKVPRLVSANEEEAFAKHAAFWACFLAAMPFEERQRPKAGKIE